MTYRDTILSDHEWSEDEDDIIDEEFVDHDDNDDEIILNDVSNKNSEIRKPFYRVRKFINKISIELILKINYQENHHQLKFFAKLFGSFIEAIVYILKYHIEKQFKFFTLEEINSHQLFYFSKKLFIIFIFNYFYFYR
jgi:hypothetical protein